MVAEDAQLLLGFVIEEFCAGNLAAANNPTVFGEVAKDIRLAGSFRSQFNDIESWFDENEKARQEFQFLLHAGKGIGVILHRGDEHVYPFLCSERFAGFSEVIYIH